MQPVLGSGHDFNVLWLEPGLLEELTVHGGLGVFTIFDPTLWELPGLFTDAFAPEDLV